MSVNKKVQELSAELADELRKRASSYTSIVESFDTAGMPTIALDDGSEATTEDSVFIRTTPRSWNLTNDVLGLPQTVYTPSVIQIVTETGTSDTPWFYQSFAHITAILGAVFFRGTRVEIWETAHGTVPNTVTPATDPTQLTGATLKTSYEASLYFPLQSSQ
jgi:hypothetical protein